MGDAPLRTSQPHPPWQGTKTAREAGGCNPRIGPAPQPQARGGLSLTSFSPAHDFFPLRFIVLSY